MKTSLIALITVVAGCGAGCDLHHTEKPSDKRAIEVDAPGTKIKVDAKDGVEVEAPVVKIDASPKK